MKPRILFYTALLLINLAVVIAPANAFIFVVCLVGAVASILGLLGVK